ncbi:MAG: ATP-binding protein [Frankia sp.]
MEMKVALSLPSEALSVPVARNICSHTLLVLGVSQDCVDDVELALAEACTNVLAHARHNDQYQVSAGVNHRVAVIEVIDRGGGFDADDLGFADADPTSERGRGIQLMRALMDNVLFEVIDGPRRGTRVLLEKRLEWESGAPIALLGDDRGENGIWANDRNAGPVTAPVQPAAPVGDDAVGPGVASDAVGPG